MNTQKMLELAKEVGATVLDGCVLFVGYEQLDKYTQAAASAQPAPLPVQPTQTAPVLTPEMRDELNSRLSDHWYGCADEVWRVVLAANTTQPAAQRQPPLPVRPAAHMVETSIGADIFVHGVEVPRFNIGTGANPARQAFVDAVNTAAAPLPVQPAKPNLNLLKPFVGGLGKAILEQLIRDLEKFCTPPAPQRQKLTDEQHEKLWEAIRATGYLTKGQVDEVMELLEAI